MSLRTPPIVPVESESIGALASRLLEDGKQFVRAEVNYYKQVALHRASGAAVGLGMAVGALFLAQSGLTALLIGLGMALARWLGPAGGVIVAGVVALLLAGLLGWLGARRITSAASGADEATAAAVVAKRR